MWFDFKQKVQVEPDFDGPMTLPWEKNERGHFWKLLHVRPAVVNLAGRGGVAAFFHRGVKPGWMFVCAGADLGDLFARAKDDPDICEFEMRGGVYVTWSYVKPSFRDGVVAHLREILRPEIQTCALDGNARYDADPIAVFPPA